MKYALDLGWKPYVPATGMVACLFAAAVLVSSPGLAGADDYRESIQNARTISAAFEHAAKEITPALVNISSVKKPPASFRRKQMPQPFGDPFYDFFGEDFLEKFFGDRWRDGFKQRGMGSGFIIDKEGHIITNDHVISGARSEHYGRHNLAHEFDGFEQCLPVVHDEHVVAFKTMVSAIQNFR